jgi:SpoVK/Ycf46/Vps4 family AAA+-type ATPase
VKWDDIIGLDHAKRLSKEAVVYPIKVSLDLIKYLIKVKRESCDLTSNG